VVLAWSVTKVDDDDGAAGITLTVNRVREEMRERSRDGQQLGNCETTRFRSAPRRSVETGPQGGTETRAEPIRHESGSGSHEGWPRELTRGLHFIDSA
jgi:hypothetical protein